MKGLSRVDKRVVRTVYSSCCPLAFTDSAEQLDVDSDAVKAVQAFGVIGVLVTAAAVLICILSELKSCTSACAALLTNVHQLRVSKIFMIVCIVGCISLMLSWIIWLDVDSDLNDSDLGFSWAFMFLASIVVAVLAFYPHGDPAAVKTSANTEGNSGAVEPA